MIGPQKVLETSGFPACETVKNLTVRRSHFPPPPSLMEIGRVEILLLHLRTMRRYDTFAKLRTVCEPFRDLAEELVAILHGQRAARKFLQRNPMLSLSAVTRLRRTKWPSVNVRLVFLSLRQSRSDLRFARPFQQTGRGFFYFNAAAFRVVSLVAVSNPESTLSALGSVTGRAGQVASDRNNHDSPQSHSIAAWRVSRPRYTGWPLDLLLAMPRPLRSAAGGVLPCNAPAPATTL